MPRTASTRPRAAPRPPRQARPSSPRTAAAPGTAKPGAARRPGRRPARRGSAGRADRRTRPGSARTAEMRHAGVRAVVGQRRDDRVARAALRAVDEGIAMSPVRRVRQFRARSRRRRRNPAAPTPAARRRRSTARCEPARDRCRASAAERIAGRASGGARVDDLARESRRRSPRPAHHDLDVAAQVLHVTVEPEFVREPVDERAKADPLHPAGHHDPAGDPACGRLALTLRAAPDALRPAQTFSRTPFAHQMRQAPSSDTMHGPTGCRGVQASPYRRHSFG